MSQRVAQPGHSTNRLTACGRAVRALLLAGVCLWFAPALAAAQQTAAPGYRPLSPPTHAADEAGDSPAAGSAAGSLLTTAGALGLVLLLFLGLARLWKKQTTTGGPLAPHVFEVLGAQPLDASQRIQLVRLGNRILVLGNGPQGLVTLSEITDPEEVEQLSAACRQSTAAPASSSFQALYEQFLGRSERASATSHATGAAAPVLREVTGG